MKERWFNYRPICLVFGFLLLGSVFSYYITEKLLTSIISAIVVAVILLTIAILKKKFKYFLIPLVSFVIGISFYYCSILNFNKTIDYQPSIIQARIYNVSNESDGMIKVEADSCYFDQTKVNDNLIIYIYDNSGLFTYIEVGSILKFKPNKFYKSDLFYHKMPSSSLYSNDLKYTTSVFAENIEYLKTDRTFAESIKHKIKNNLHLSLSNENAEIAYSALFGDKDMLSDKQYSAYKMAGVAHLLAVSGLHVGIIVGIFNFIFKKFRVNKWCKFSIIAIFLLFYAYICGFSISVIRASIMSLILLAASNFRREYDPFNAISLAGIVIFVMNPLCIFDVSFLLSFACAIGITMLFMPIQEALKKSRMPKLVVDSASMSLATTIAIVIIMAFYFRTLNIISILANVILIPIFTFAFTIIFVISMLSVLLHNLSYLLYPINYILNFINIIATALGNIPFANMLTLEINYIGIIMYFVLLLFMGRFCTTKYQYKVVTTVPMVALLFYCLL